MDDRTISLFRGDIVPIGLLILETKIHLSYVPNEQYFRAKPSQLSLLPSLTHDVTHEAGGVGTSAG